MKPLANFLRAKIEKEETLQCQVILASGSAHAGALTLSKENKELFVLSTPVQRGPGGPESVMPMFLDPESIAAVLLVVEEQQSILQ